MYNKECINKFQLMTKFKGYHYYIIIMYEFRCALICLFIYIRTIIFGHLLDSHISRGWSGPVTFCHMMKRFHKCPQLKWSSRPQFVWVDISTMSTQNTDIKALLLEINGISTKNLCKIWFFSFQIKILFCYITTFITWQRIHH